LHQRLEAAFGDLWELCPLGQAEVIVSAGAYVDKPGWHGRGLAFDLDSIFWPGRAFVTRSFPTDPLFYLAVEAVLRRHWGTVLAFNYNAAHRDHFHVQHGREVGLVHSLRSDVLFIQGAASYVLDIPVTIDGVWGPETRGALAEAQQLLGVTDDLGDVETWKSFLKAVAGRGFGTLQADTPRDRLVALHRVIATELGETEERKRIEAAVTAFTDLPQIQAALSQSTVNS